MSKTLKVMPTDEVVAVAEGDIPVTGKMILDWCAAYDSGSLPDGYTIDDSPAAGRPNLGGGRGESPRMSFRCSEESAALINEAVAASGTDKSEFLRSAALEKATAILDRAS